MDVTSLKRKMTEFIKKYKYVAIVLVVGVALMLLPSKGSKEAALEQTEVTTPQTEQADSINQQLADILSKIEGAGNVQVLLTVSAGEEIVYQTDDAISVNGDSSTTQIETVIITGADKGQEGLIRQVNPPTYLGAIVVCQGADRPTVQLAIVDAVSKVTGLGADRISVLKMK